MSLLQSYADWHKAHFRWNQALMLLSASTFIVGLGLERHEVGGPLEIIGVACFLIGAGNIIVGDRRRGETAHCPLCHDKGYLINEGLRVFEDCLCQQSTEETVSSPGDRQRPSGLAERQQRLA